jgi:hypothetical protein
MYIYTFLLRMTDTVTSQNIDVSSWDTLYKYHFVSKGYCGKRKRAYTILHFLSRSYNTESSIVQSV